MKKSIKFLPQDNQDELEFIVQNVLKRLKQTEMIILFGSYARNSYVAYDRKWEFGKVQTYLSDYDLLIVTSGVSDGVAIKALDNVEDIYYNKSKNPDRQPPVQFISEDITKLNKALKEGRYFYTQIKREGIVLYDSGKHKLARRRKLNFEEIKGQAQEYFDEKYEVANEFLHTAKLIYKEGYYVRASFQLHQASENYFYATRLVYTLENSKLHNLSKLLNSVRKYSKDFINVFPRDTKEEKRLFELLKAAYVNGRYDPDFVVTKEDIEALIPKVERLRDITQSICEAGIDGYGKMKDEGVS